MRKLKNNAIWAMAALLFVFMIGCTCKNDECKGSGAGVAPIVPPASAAIHRPTVTFVTPYNTEIGVPINWDITATFSEAMNASTIDITTFTVTGPGVVPVFGGVTYDAINHIAIFDPGIDLLPNTTYMATITTGAQNPAGSSLEIPFVWIFTTGATADTTNPTVILTYPANLDSGVPMNTAVTATFSEAMISTTITAAGTFTLYQGATQITGVVTYVGLIATFTPSSPLSPSLPYTATISTAATDLAGNPLLSPVLVPVPNPWTFTTGATADTTRPTVILVNPINLAVGVPVTTHVDATFSEAMLPGTIITANFKLTGPGLTPVLGTVGYNILTHVGTFIPLAPLTINTTYTATVTTGVQDLAGNAMLSDYVWTFTTPKVLSPLLVNLASAAHFAVLSNGGITDNPAPQSLITGDIGVDFTTGASITGVVCLNVTGTIYTIDAAGPACRIIDAVGLPLALADLRVAYNDAAGRLIPAPVTVAGNIGGSTRFAGIYKSTSSLGILSGDLTLDAQGDVNAVWIFQIASSLTTIGCAPFPCASGGNVKLINGANAANVFWQVGSAATIGGFTDFYGTIMAYDSISIGSYAQIHGRLLAGAHPLPNTPVGAVTLISDTIVIP